MVMLVAQLSLLVKMEHNIIISCGTNEYLQKKNLAPGLRY